MSESPLDQGRDLFMEEAYELLSQLEESLMELEDVPDDMEVVGRIFRALHTIKGSGAMFGFDKISSFTHSIENVFDQVRSSKLPVTKELIDISLKAQDIIKIMLDSERGARSVDEGAVKNIENHINTFLNNGKPVQDNEDIAMQRGGDRITHDKDRGSMTTWRIQFRPPADIFSTGMDPAALLDELKELGKCDIVCMTEEIPRLSELDPEKLHIWWDILLTTDKGRDSIEDVFIFVADESEINIDPVHIYDQIVEEPTIKKLGQILLDRGEIRSEELEDALNEQSRIGEILVKKDLISEAHLKLGLREQEHIKDVTKNIQQKTVSADKISSIRVTSDRLDHLVNLVGELVTVQARFTQLANSRQDPQFIFLSEEVERLSSELRDNAMTIRMLPIASTFNKFRRLVRDLAGELGKEIILSTSGEETELDKTVIEKLNDPLVHLIRNSVDHGIESPEIRRQCGKAEQGAINLSAEHSGAHVLITIKDDGAGLDPERILAKAEEKGLLKEGPDLSEKEIYNLIFQPGFSTAARLSNVSGRGVGMDVVKNNIDDLRGEIEVESAKGKGTTVTLKIPLTLAIIEGLLTRTGEEYYVVPLSVVEECLELSATESGMSKQRNLANIRNELIPYVSLRDRFVIKGKRPGIEQVIVTNVAGSRIGFVVDEVVGHHQTVIKNLGKMYQDVKEISGATILGDGNVALILDVAQIYNAAQEAESMSLH